MIPLLKKKKSFRLPSSASVFRIPSASVFRIPSLTIYNIQPMSKGDAHMSTTTRKICVNKWGNSLGIRLPIELADYFQIKEKSLVEISAEGDKLIITKIN